MAILLKDIYNDKFFRRFICSMLEVVSDFDEKSFLHCIYDNDWIDRTLKQRMRHITIILKKHLSDDYSKNVDTILKLIPVLESKGFKADGLEFLFIPDFIEVYGIEHCDSSVKAIETITQFVSCEFAVRPFIFKKPESMLRQMLEWSAHEHPMVRRLASEGCRPRLPWAIAMPFLIDNPEPIIPILEKLKNDVSDTVRRSVANNLNDISKDNPSIVIDIVKRWIGVTKNTDALTKHACRTLLKNGNLEVMKLFGLGDVNDIRILGFKTNTPVVKIGGVFEFVFDVVNTKSTVVKIRLEYGIYYQKANGSLAKKVYKISEKRYSNNSTVTVHRKQSFKIISTRKLHVGKHQISVIVNGVEFEKIDFELIE